MAEKQEEPSVPLLEIIEEAPLRLKSGRTLGDELIREVIEEESREESMMMKDELSRMRGEGQKVYDSGIFVVTDTTLYGGEEPKQSSIRASAYNIVPQSSQNDMPKE